MLGYSNGQPTSFSKFGVVPSEFFMDNVQCSGNEASLFECHFNHWDNCGINEGAGVICSVGMFHSQHVVFRFALMLNF